MAMTVAHRLFTVDEYQRMAQAGILSEDENVELIGGEIVAVAPIGSRHAACVDRLTDGFAPGLTGRAIVRIQGPLRLDDYSEPVPDVMILRRREDFYRAALPGPADVLLIIEVADTSEHYDRQVKVPLYARAGIAEAWLVDINAGTVTLYRQPGPGGYRQALVVTVNDSLTPLAFPDFVLTVAGILG